MEPGEFLDIVANVLRDSHLVESVRDIEPGPALEVVTRYGTTFVLTAVVADDDDG